MIIDFHTHIFPDEIAERTIGKLEKVGNITAFTNGRLDGLKRSMRDSGIDLSVILPVVTKPVQFNSVNSFAAQITGQDGIISFGGIHPDSEDFKVQLKTIRDLGLLGIKLHPDYQDTYIDDPKYIRIIHHATELGLIVIIHAGLDIGLPEPIHCTPKRVARMLYQLDATEQKIILAHMGGYDLWNEVEELIVGRNVFLDTSYSLGIMKDSQFLRIVKEHGADRILFATDSPWAGQKEAVEHLKAMDLTEEELAMIFYKNAGKLLKMEV